MKHLKKLLFVFALIGIASSVSAQGKIWLKGIVKDRPKSDTLLLSLATTSIRDAEKIISIPVKDGKFEYRLDAANMEAYQLVFLDEMQVGGWRPIIFFPDSSTVELTLHAMSLFDENIITGGIENRTYEAVNKKLADRYKSVIAELYKEVETLRAAGIYRSKEHGDLILKLNKAKTNDESLPIFDDLAELKKTGAEYTPAGQAINLKLDSVNRLLTLYKYELIRQTISPAMYYHVWKDAATQIKEKRDIAEFVSQIFPIYAAKFPNHPYTKAIKDRLTGAIQTIPGGLFVDFSAPSIDGKAVKLSEQIAGKLAVIDLWASWCGPCIAKAKALVPVYNKYKNKGFTIVGVAREFKNLNALKFRLKQESFSWQHLVELDDKNGIWRKYAVGDGGGMQVLVDQKGIILAINPSATEVEQYIKRYLKI